MKSLNTELLEDGLHVTDSNGLAVAVISYQPVAPSVPWLVTFAPGFQHGTDVMWWRNLKAAEYHVLAVYADHMES